MSRARRTNHTITALVVAAIVGATTLSGGAAARADDYPSWDDVQAAKASESAKQSEVDQITQLLAQLKDEASAAQQQANERWTLNEKAQKALEDGQKTADSLADRAATLQASADASKKQAAQLAAQFARLGGGEDVTSMLLTSSSGESDDLLGKLGSLSKLSQTVSGVYATAKTQSNDAAAMSDQAQVAKDALTSLANTAASSLSDALSAQKAAVSAVNAQSAHESELQAQLASLTQNVATTEADYQAGIAAAEAAAAAAAAAAAQAGSAPGAPISDDARTLALELVGDIQAGRLTGAQPDHLQEIEWIAAGDSVENCGIDTQILAAIVVAVRTFGSAGVSDINRKCTGQIEGAGIYSAHYVGGGGHAVDFNALDGQGLSGADDNSLRLIAVLDQVMPSGSGLGQRQCRINAGDEPDFANFHDFADTCTHLHVDDLT
ncbi:coiled-coil domain-containing protein [Agreia sp. Leaf210]|uniref:coiled-coil domain-containing protein n=1 Tax=Agreia sp. Leaf210 TaxID=1735682 RepID=UPI0006F38EEA|nr:hypothetical protein [Agreia sp. Leaf210]KQM57106.1 hypothetical protein ASE64_16950 [Agreia sp. Leaf210]